MIESLGLLGQLRAMRRSVLAGRALCVILFLAVTLHVHLVDGLHGEILGLIGNEDTEYAAGYSDSRWRCLRLGMSAREVHDTLGAPFEMASRIESRVGPLMVYRWARSSSDKDYRIRAIQFQDGVVVSVLSGYHID